MTAQENHPEEQAGGSRDPVNPSGGARANGMSDASTEKPTTVNEDPPAPPSVAKTTQRRTREPVNDDARDKENWSKPSWKWTFDPRIRNPIGEKVRTLCLVAMFDMTLIACQLTNAR